MRRTILAAALTAAVSIAAVPVAGAHELATAEDIAELKARLDSLEGRVNSQSATIDAIFEELDAAKARADQLESRADGQGSAIDDIYDILDSIDAFLKQRDVDFFPKEKPMKNLAITVDWRAVSRNVPSRQMPRSVPWVHGLIREAWGKSQRIELSPKRQKNDDAPVHLILLHPDQDAAEAMDWDATMEVTVDGHTVETKKSIGPAEGWCGPDTWNLYALVAEIDADHPLVVHAAEAAKAPQEAMDKAVIDFDRRAMEWSDKNFPHPDFMNEMRSVFYDQWNGRLDYWPGDSLPDFDTIMTMAQDRIRAT